MRSVYVSLGPCRRQSAGTTRSSSSRGGKGRGKLCAPPNQRVRVVAGGRASGILVVVMVGGRDRGRGRGGRGCLVKEEDRINRFWAPYRLAYMLGLKCISGECLDLLYFLGRSLTSTNDGISVLSTQQTLETLLENARLEKNDKWDYTDSETW